MTNITININGGNVSTEDALEAIKSVRTNESDCAPIQDDSFTQASSDLGIFGERERDKLRNSLIDHLKATTFTSGRRCAELVISLDGWLKDNSLFIHESKSIPENKGDCDYRWVRVDGKELTHAKIMTESDFMRLLSSSSKSITIGDKVTAEFFPELVVKDINDFFKSDNSFSITKEQYDKDIAQAKVDGVSDYIRKMSADISNTDGYKVSWRDKEATEDDKTAKLILKHNYEEKINKALTKCGLVLVKNVKNRNEMLSVAELDNLNYSFIAELCKIFK